MQNFIYKIVQAQNSKKYPVKLNDTLDRNVNYTWSADNEDKQG